MTGYTPQQAQRRPVQILTLIKPNDRQRDEGKKTKKKLKTLK